MPIFSRRASALLDEPTTQRRLSLGCPVLDAALGGGLDHHGITEIAGEAGAGKTQLALQLLLQAQLPPQRGGLGGGAVYLHTDGASHNATMSRLRSLAEAFARQHADLGATQERLLAHVYTIHVDSAEELWTVVSETLPALCDTSCVRLVVVDSIAVPFRTLTEEMEQAGGPAATSAAAYGERTSQLLLVAARLKQLSANASASVVVTNQVSDKPLDAADRRRTPPWAFADAAVSCAAGARRRCRRC